MVFQNSRYVQTQVFMQDSETAILAPRDIPTYDLTDATHYTFTEGDTLDGVAYKLYGNAQLWWAILDANQRYQSELEISPGDVLTIPPYSEVVKYSE